MFFKTIALDGLLGKTNYYAVRVKFQVRTSAHIHPFIWIFNAPKLKSSAIPEYMDWLYSIIRTDLPNSNAELIYEVI